MRQLRDMVIGIIILGAAAAAGAGEDDVQTLAARLSAPQPDLRIEAARALAARAPDVKTVLPELAAALQNEYWDVRMGASEALRKVGADAVPVLVAALRDRHFWSRLHAAQTLGRIGPAARDAVPALAQALRDAAIDVRLEAARALAAIGHVEPVAKDLAAALADPNDGVRTAAVEAVSRSGRAALREITALLEHEDAGVSRAAATALEQIGPEAAEATGALVRRLKAEVRETNRIYGSIENEGIRTSRIGHAIRASAVVAALGRMGRAAAEPVAECLQGADETMARYVLEILGRLGPDAKTAAPAVLKAYRTSADAWQRARAAGALGAIGAGCEGVVPALAEGLAGPDEVVRRHSAYALGMLGPEGIARLVEALKAKAPECRIAAAQGLERAGRAAKAAAPALREAANDEDEAVRSAAEAALKAIGP